MGEVRWIFFAGAALAGILGRIGLRKGRTCFLLLSAGMLPVLLFAGLWCRLGLADLSFCFCLTALWILYGLGKERK